MTDTFHSGKRSANLANHIQLVEMFQGYITTAPIEGNCKCLFTALMH